MRYIQHLEVTYVSKYNDFTLHLQRIMSLVTKNFALKRYVLNSNAM
jgi:hypothetical protein